MRLILEVLSDGGWAVTDIVWVYLSFSKMQKIGKKKARTVAGQISNVSRWSLATILEYRRTALCGLVLRRNQRGCVDLQQVQRARVFDEVWDPDPNLMQDGEVILECLFDGTKDVMHTTCIEVPNLPEGEFGMSRLTFCCHVSTPVQEMHWLLTRQSHNNVRPKYFIPSSSS